MIPRGTDRPSACYFLFLFWIFSKLLGLEPGFSSYAPISGVLSSFLAVLSNSENCLPQSWGHMVSKMGPK